MGLHYRQRSELPFFVDAVPVAKFLPSLLLDTTVYIDDLVYE